MAVMAQDAELCARLGRALDATMRGGDFAYAEHVRRLLIELAGDAELRARVREHIDLAAQAGDLAVVRALSDALTECNEHVTSWKKKVRKLMDPSVVAG